MAEEPNHDSKIKPDVAGKPVIPPPDLARHAPAPPSPLDKLHKSTPAKPAAENPDARVNLRPTRGPSVTMDEDSSHTGIASFNSRVVAVFVDILVATGVTIGLSWILPGFAERLAQLAGLAYFITRDSLPFLGGRSVGKKAMRLKVTALDGNSLVNNWQAALIRNGVLLVPLFPLVEVFILLSRDGGPDHGRRLGDEWAKTQVKIDEKPVAAGEDETADPS